MVSVGPRLSYFLYCGKRGTGNFENRVWAASAMPFRSRNCDSPFWRMVAMYVE